MCKMDKITSAALAFTPLESENYLKDIEEVLQMIKESGLEYRIDLLTTTIRGEKSLVLNLINQIFIDMDKRCKFTMDVKISNICGC